MTCEYVFIGTELCASWRPTRLGKVCNKLGMDSHQANPKNQLKNQRSGAEKSLLGASAVVSREAWRLERMGTAVCMQFRVNLVNNEN